MWAMFHLFWASFWRPLQDSVLECLPYRQKVQKYTTLHYCWPTVYDAGPKANQRWASVSFLLGSVPVFSSIAAQLKRDVYLLLLLMGQCRKRWPHINPTLGGCLVFSGIPYRFPWHYPHVQQAMWLTVDRHRRFLTSPNSHTSSSDRVCYPRETQTWIIIRSSVLSERKHRRYRRYGSANYNSWCFTRTGKNAGKMMRR